MGRNQNDQRYPDELIFLDFLGSDTPRAKAKILHWFPVCENSESDVLEDIAVLKIIDPLPAGVSPAPVAVPNEQADRVRMCGFPRYAPGGTYVTAILQGPIKNGSIELHPEDNRTALPGFSGTAAWDMEKHAVSGMIVSKQDIAPTTHNVY
ncbi:MAG: hypothetical protein D3909_15725, partial [Candidatus Electrothrix sp. ATG1]|nr:hypothetical protein [Candidatus Electrothrix sp. ATG1]